MGGGPARHGDTPRAGWLIRTIPIKMDDSCWGTPMTKRKPPMYGYGSIAFWHSEGDDQP